MHILMFVSFEEFLTCCYVVEVEYNMNLLRINGKMLLKKLKKKNKFTFLSL